MAGGEAIMVNINFKDGLIYVDATLVHGKSSITIKKALVDTGSAATVISRDIAHELGLRPEPTLETKTAGGTNAKVDRIMDSEQYVATQLHKEERGNCPLDFQLYL